MILQKVREPGYKSYPVAGKTVAESFLLASGWLSLNLSIRFFRGATGIRQLFMEKNYQVIMPSDKWLKSK
jgi:hypothetical protein